MNSRSAYFSWMLAVTAIGTAGWLGYTNLCLRKKLEETSTDHRGAQAAARAVAFQRKHDAILGPARESQVIPPDSGAAPAQVDGLAEIKKLWQDPAWRADRFSAEVIRVERKYGKFLQYLQGRLTPAQVEDLKRQLAANDLAMQMALLPESSSPSEAEMQAMGATAQRTAAENKERLRASLGDEGFDKFEAFEQSLAYQESVASTVNAMRSNGLPVDDRLEDAILNGYTTAIRGAAAAASVTGSAADLSRMTAVQKLELKKKQISDFNLRIASEMSKVLDQKQLQAFMEAQFEQQYAEP